MREMKDIRNERGSYVDVDVDSRSTGGGLIGRGTITGERKPSQDSNDGTILSGKKEGAAQLLD